MKNKKEDLLFKKTLRIFLLIIIPLLIFFTIFNTPLTGFSISNKSTGVGVVSIIAGSFLGTITLFFIFLLIILKIRAKAFKAHTSKK